MAKVNISEAARLAGVSRSTFYRHIETKGISTSKDREGNPTVETSELVRVYGALQDTTTRDTPQKRHNETEKSTPSNTLEQAENALLREQIADKNDVIADLRKRLDASDARLNHLLTDQRSPANEPSHGVTFLGFQISRKAVRR